MNIRIKTILGLVILAASQIVSATSTTNDSSDWYLQLDLNGIKSSAFSNGIEQERKKSIEFLHTLFSEQVIDEIRHITAYGNIQKSGKKRTMIIDGNFAPYKQQIGQKWQQLGLEDKKESGEQTIYQGQAREVFKKLFQEAKKSGFVDKDADKKIERLDERPGLDKTVYAVFTPNSKIAIGDDLAEIEALLLGKKQVPGNSQAGLFEVVVDVQKAMMHAGVNLDEEAQMFSFESISAKQLSQVSVSYNEDNMYSELQLGLSAETTETANKIKSVVQGLIALKSLTVKSTIVKDLLSSVRFEQSAGELRVIMAGSVDSFKALIDSND